MSKVTIRIRFISFEDTTDQALSNIYFYLKKLKQTPTAYDSSMLLEEKDPESAVVLSDTETYDLSTDDEYFQILFIKSIPKPNAIADIIFWQNYLLDLLNDPRYNKVIKPELPCSIPIEPNYIFQFTLQILGECIVPLRQDQFLSLPNRKKDLHNREISILGHLMQIKQFNHPVYCAICNRFVWGIHEQGYECLRCSLVTHRKCRQRIPFRCHQSTYPELYFSSQNRQFKFNNPHVFKPHEALFVDHGHCKHCGSQVSRRHTRKCAKCHFIVHDHCEANVPLMCTISYISIAESIENEIFRIVEPKDDPVLPTDARISIEKEDDNYSDSSSVVLPWPDPLEKQEPVLLPKFSDFEYIGRLGDGASGKVYCAQHIQSKEYVAIKVTDGLNKQARRQFEVERKILYRYSHGNPYMIQAYCTFHQGNKLFLVTELVDGDTLNAKIVKTRMNEDEIRFYLAEIISVLQYLHSNKIVYRDLKLEHAIVCSEGHIRIVDYGLGRLLKTADEICHTVCGTYSYMAPEVRRLETDEVQGGYSYPVDFWALGIMFLQMLCGDQFDFHPSNLGENLKLVRYISSEARECVTGLLEIDAEKRLGSPNSPHGLIRDHPFFNVGRKINWQEIDDGVFKPIHKRRSVMRIISDLSTDLPLPTLSLDRGLHAKADWIAAGQSTCTVDEEEQLKSFDYINQSLWAKLNP